MKLDRLIQKFLPHDDKFFTLLGESTRNLLMAADLTKQLMNARDQNKQRHLVNEIKDLEHRGDAVTHKIFSELNATFVTPLDREDIHVLTAALDDILDHIDGSAGRMVLYNVKKAPPQMVRLSEVLYRSVEELHRGVSLMRDLHHTERFMEVFQKVNQYENEADSIFDQAIQRPRACATA